MSQVEIRIYNPAENAYFDGGDAWNTSEIWFTVDHDNASGSWSWADVPHELIAGFENDTVTISVRALDDETSCSACTATMYSCNVATQDVTLENDAPEIDITPSSLVDLDDTSTVSGTMSDTEQNNCGDPSGYFVHVRIQNEDDNEFWNGGGWQVGETWVLATTEDWGAGTWTYEIPATGFQHTLGGTLVNVTARATDNYDVETTTIPVNGNILNHEPMIDITSLPTGTIDFPFTIEGTFEDDSFDGTIGLLIVNDDTTQCWDGSAWDAPPCSVVPNFTWTDGHTPPATWSYILPAAFFSGHGGDHFTVQATIDDGLAPSVSDSESGIIVNDDPQVTITSSLANLNNSSSISGGLVDDSRSGSVSIQIRNTTADPDVFYDGAGWSTDSTTSILVSTVTWSNSGSWVSDALGSGFKDGTNGGDALTVTVEAIDVHLASGTASGTGAIANVGPTVSIDPFSVPLDDITQITGDHDDPDGPNPQVDVSLEIHDTDFNLYWNGGRLGRADRG